MIKLQNLGLQRGVKTLIDSANLEIYPSQKVAIIGPNGCGKSSLFSLLLGLITADAGECTVAKHWQIVAIAQYIDDTSRTAIDYVIDGDKHLRQVQSQLVEAEQQNDGAAIARLHEQLEHAGAYDVESRAATILAGLGFSEQELRKTVDNFSGGWQMRLNLARALLCPSDLLLLDEPTNHLDLDAVIWLQDYLQNYAGTLLLISHDQHFIDACAKLIISFENTQLHAYTGNYTSYQKQRAERIILAQKQFEKQQTKKQHLESFITRFKAKASKAKQAQSRVKQLEKMEELLPIQQANEFSFDFREPEKLPNPLINMEEIELGYGETTILSNIQLNLVPGSRIGLLGRNGAGKSTFIKLLAGELDPLQGRYTTSAGLQIGYFAQHQVQALHLESSAFDHLLRLDKTLSDQQIRDYLGGFGFHGDEALKKVAPMSGGEKARLVLALIVYTKPNLLLLDEPTNHLDMNMREALAYALQSFDGAMVIVSHDRYLLESVCDDFYLVDSGRVSPFAGDLGDYQKWLLQNKPKDAQAKKDQAAANAQGVSSLSIENGTEQKIDRKALKRMQAEFRNETKKEREQIAKCEKDIARLTDELAEVEQLMGDTSLYSDENKAQLNEVIARQTKAKQALEETEMLWLDAQDSLELAQADFDKRMAGA